MTGTSTQSDARTVPGLFRYIAADQGDRPALESGGTCVTYAELDRLSNGVAHALLRRGGREPIAMVTPLEPSSIVAMLGALKAGRIFAPLDPREPPERRRMALDRLGAHIVMTAGDLPGPSDEEPQVALHPDLPALIYFTSGSTGRPRGVIRSQGHLTQPAATHNIMSNDRFGVILPLTFGGSMVAVFGSLLAGSAICLFDPVTNSIGALAEWIDDAGVTVFQTSPSVLRAIAGELDARNRAARSVRLVIMGGDSCRGDQLELVRRVLPAATITNHYGSTEGGGVACTRIPPGVPLEPGPILFRHIYPEQIVEIVDGAGQGVAPGQPGEIRVSSRRVALGYWGEDPRSEERPFVDEGDGVRSIRLGDRACLHEDGTLELLGRADLRVKVHGQMADLEAVERAIEALPGVSEAIVSAVADRDGDTRLVAHVLAPRRGWSTRGVRAALADRLPAFLIPSTFFRVSAIPRNARGKVDRELLQQAAATGVPERREYTAPRNAREAMLAEVIADALGLDRVGVHDDIFDLGADSLSMVGLAIAISESTGVAVGAADLLGCPTVETLAGRLEGSRGPAERVAVPVYGGGSGTPIFYVPAGGGSGMVAMRRLGRRLGRPAFSFIARGFETRALPDRTIERTAARFAEALLGVQSAGPYLVAGFSVGGLVAFEMARQLRAAGRDVALLVLVDPVSRPSARLSQHLSKGWTELTDSRARVADRIPGLARRVGTWAMDRYKARTAGLIRRPPHKQSDVFFRLDTAMARRYRMKPYDGPCLLLRTDEWRRADILDYTRFLTGKVRERTIPGTHRTMTGEPYLGTLSEILREELARAMKKQGEPR